MTRPIIYFDLDGVLADFDRGVFDMLGIDLSIADNEFDREAKDKVFKSDSFFINLKLMTGAHRMVEYAKGYDADVKVLTATGYSNEDGVANQKRAWVKRHFGDLEVHTVPKSGDKAKFAWPDVILIDDRLEKSIGPFREKGGIGIHHVHPYETMHELDEVMKELNAE